MWKEMEVHYVDEDGGLLTLYVCIINIHEILTPNEDRRKTMISICRITIFKT